MVDKNGNESRAVPVLSMYEYLGLLLDEYGELAEHILQEVLPEVRRRLWARSSTIATHDILAPEASLRFIDSGGFVCGSIQLCDLGAQPLVSGEQSEHTRPNRACRWNEEAGGSCGQCSHNSRTGDQGRTNRGPG